MRTYTKEQLIHYLKQLQKITIKTPTTKEMNAHKKFPSSSTYRNRFGSWNKALKIANISPNTTKYTKKKLIENLKLRARELKRTPKTKELTSWTGSYTTYKKYFGSWNNALKKAGLLSQVTNLKQYSRKRHLK